MSITAFSYADQLAWLHRELAAVRFALPMGSERTRQERMLLSLAESVKAAREAGYEDLSS